MHEAGTEAGGQKIKPCPPHLLSCSGGAGISLSKEVCVCVYVHVGEWFPRGAFCTWVKEIQTLWQRKM